MKPCDHCGSSDIEKWSNPYNAWIVMCNGCGCSTSGDHSEEDAVEIWDRRVSEGIMTEAKNLLRRAEFNMAQHDIARSLQEEIHNFLEGK